MSLTVGTGPFSRRPSGQFNFRREGPASVLYWEPCPRRVRAVVDGVTVADSRRVRLLHETGHLPVYYLPAEDFAQDLLEPSATTTHCPYKGDAAYWSLRVGERLIEDALWGYDDPLPSAPPLAGYRALYWDRVDAWYEEDEMVFVHPRDPYHRVDVLASSRQVVVALDGVLLAESSTPVAVFETGLPARWYLPRSAVRDGVLVPEDTVSRCPYKGLSRGFSVRAGDVVHQGLAWSYTEPTPAVTVLRDRIMFLQEKLEVTLDGEPTAPRHRADGLT